MYSGFYTFGLDGYLDIFVNFDQKTGQICFLYRPCNCKCYLYEVWQWVSVCCYF